jgi:hypothetical protein
VFQARLAPRVPLAPRGRLARQALRVPRVYRVRLSSDLLGLLPLPA